MRTSIRDNRARVVYSAMWYPYPWRVVVGDVPLAHGEDPDKLRVLADRFNDRLTVDVLRHAS